MEIIEEAVRRAVAEHGLEINEDALARLRQVLREDIARYGEVALCPARVALYAEIVCRATSCQMQRAC